MSVSEEPRPEDLVAEAEGDTLGEAKWAAMKELEVRFPGLTADCVRFDVAEDAGAEGPARVRAEVDHDAWRAVAETIPEEPAERVRAIVTRVVNALGLHATVDIDESGEEIRATVNGDDLGLLIGKHGSTIDALQHLAFRAAAEALRYGRPVELEPMRATERKIVHTYLSERSDVETHSEGDEPDRRLVVSPVERFS